MIKTFCDSCGKEILKGDEVASITSIENQLRPVLAQGLPGTTLEEEQAVQVTRLACDDCFKKIKKILYAKNEKV